MLYKSHKQHNQFGVKGFLHTVESGLKLYGTAKASYEAIQGIAAGVRAVAPVIAGMGAML